MLAPGPAHFRGLDEVVNGLGGRPGADVERVAERQPADLHRQEHLVEVHFHRGPFAIGPISRIRPSRSDSVQQQADHVVNALLDRLRRGEVEAQRLAERVLVREIEEAQRHATDEQLPLVHVRAEAALAAAAVERDAQRLEDRRLERRQVRLARRLALPQVFPRQQPHVVRMRGEENVVRPDQPRQQFLRRQKPVRQLDFRRGELLDKRGGARRGRGPPCCRSNGRASGG